jgi:hypothetical protein
MADKFSDLEKQIRDLNDKINRLGGKSFSNIDDILKSINGNVKDANAYISQMNAEAEFLENAFDNISTSLKNALNDLNKQSDLVRQVNKSYNKLESISRQIVDHQKNENILSLQKLKTLQKQSQEEVKNLRAKRDALEQEAKNNQLVGKQLEYYNEINDALNKETGILKDINSLIEKEVKLEQKRNSNLGITGGIFKGIHKSMKDIGIESEAFDRINVSMREAAANGNAFSTITAGIKSTAGELVSSFEDTAVQVAIISKTFNFLKGVLFAWSENTFKIQQSLGISYAEAENLNRSLNTAFMTSKGLLSTQEDLVKAQLALSEYSGLNVQYSAKTLDNFTRLTQVAGLTTEEAGKLQEYSDLTGKSTDDLYDSMGKVNKGILNNKKVMSQVLKIDGQMAANYKNNPVLLAKAVTQVNKLGISMEQAQKMSQSLLNFESSIEDELSAELLTGQNLNLERARSLALQGKSAESAAELLKQTGGLSKFQNMNVIQQEALAKSMGMTTDELANQLVKAEQYKNLKNGDAKLLQDKIQKLKEAGKIEEANALEKQALESKNVALSEQQLSDQAKMDKAMQSMKQSFVGIIAPFIGPLSKAVEKLAQFMQNPIVKTIAGIAGALLAAGGLALSVMSLIKLVKGAFGGGVKKVFVTNMGGGMGDDDSSLPNVGRNKTGMKIFKSLSKLVGGKKTWVGRGLRSLAAYMGKSGATSGLGDVANLASKGFKGANFLGKAGSALSKTGPMLAKTLKFLGPIGAVADLGMGAYSGAQAGSMSKEEQKAAGIRQGMSSTEGGIAGFMTGGAEKGSVMSEYVGIEKGSGADEAMGVAGAAGRGALVGAMFGPLGAGIGGLVGGIAESVKLLANPDSQLRKTISGWGDSISDFNTVTKETLKGWGSSMGNYFSNILGDIKKRASAVWGDIKSKGSVILGDIKKRASAVWGDIKSSNIGSSISNGVSNVEDFFGLAEGGIVTGPTKALIGEAGQSEAVIPLNQFYAKLDQLIAAVSNPQTSNGMVIKLDGQKVGEALRLGTRAVQ